MNNFLFIMSPPKNLSSLTIAYHIPVNKSQSYFGLVLTTLIQFSILNFSKMYRIEQFFSKGENFYGNIPFSEPGKSDCYSGSLAQRRFIWRSRRGFRRLSW